MANRPTLSRRSTGWPDRRERALVCLRHNLSQVAVGESLGVTQPIIVRAVKTLNELVICALDGYLMAAE